MAPRHLPTPLLGLLILASLTLAAFAVPVVGAKDPSGKHEGKSGQQDTGKSNGAEKKEGLAAEQPPPPPVAADGGSGVQAAPGPAEGPVTYGAL